MWKLGSVRSMSQMPAATSTASIADPAYRVVLWVQIVEHGAEDRAQSFGNGTTPKDINAIVISLVNANICPYRSPQSPIKFIPH